MADKGDVKICVGTACFVQGGADLLMFNDFLDDELLSKCNIDAANCFEECKKCSVTGEKSPFVTINGKVYGNMTVDKLSKIIREAVNA